MRVSRVAAAAPHRRCHHTDPLCNRKCGGDDRCVHERRDPRSAPGGNHEQQQAGRKQRVAGEIEDVGGRRRWRVHLDQPDHIADDEAGVPKREQDPRQPSLRTIHPNGPEDRDHGRGAQALVDHRLRGSTGREREIDGRQSAAGGDVDRAQTEP